MSYAIRNDLRLRPALADCAWRFHPCRTMALGGIAALCLASAASPGVAASLKGKSFLLDAGYNEIGKQYALIFRSGGGFAANFAVPADGASLPNEVHYKSFTKTGKTVAKKTLVAKATEGPFENFQVINAGGFDLGDKRSLVGFIDLGLFNKDKAVGGMFGRIVDDEKPKGDKVVFDNSKKNTTGSGSIIPLSDERGLAYWQTFDETAGTFTSGARFVTADGKPDGKPVNITREKSNLISVSTFGSGFVTLQSRYTEFPIQSLYLQAYDANGDKVGPEGVIVKEKDQYINQQNPLILDAGKKTVVFLRAAIRPSDGDLELRGQVYDDKWKKVGTEKVLIAKGVDVNAFAATSLPGGEILVANAVHVGDSTYPESIEVRRFTRDLKPTGPVAKTKPTEGTQGVSFLQLLTLKNGDAVLSYADSDSKLTGQIIKP